VTLSSQPIQPQNLIFRQMTAEDIPRVHEIDALSFTLPWPEKSYLFELNENPSTLAMVVELVGKEAGRLVIGMAIVWVVVDEAHIATIAIHPDFRGRGYGKRLLGACLRQVIQRGARLATLEVRVNNLLAQQMYLSFGFAIAGRRLRYYKDNNEDAIIMTLQMHGANYLERLRLLEV
jgi:ribosomal-protein-alanine N-acetyltransferase